MMKYKTIEEWCDILDSQRIPISAKDRIKGIYPYYGANGVQDYIDNYIFDDELVLLAEDGGNFGSKKRPIAYRVSGKCWVNNHAHVLKPKKDLNVDYLCYSLMFYDTNGLVNGATRQKLTQSTMRKMKIPYLKIENQLEIVKKIKKIEAVIQQQNKQLFLLDELIKARFIEMFGDPINNSKSFPSKKVVDVVTMQRGYDLPTSKRISSGNIPVYGSNGILGYHDTSKCDVGVITGRSGTLGEVTFSDRPFWPLNTTLFSVDIHNNNIIYLKYLLEFYDLKRFGSGTGVPTLNRNEFHNEPIIDVPLTLQNEFADFVKLIDKSKFINKG